MLKALPVCAMFMAAAASAQPVSAGISTIGLNLKANLIVGSMKPLFPSWRRNAARPH
jgi:hypothetical protein